MFSHDEVQEKLGKAWIPLMACAVVAGGILIGTTFGQDNTSPQYLGSPLNCIYGWLMCLAMMAWFQAKYDCTSPFAAYMTRSSYGLYIVHYRCTSSWRSRCSRFLRCCTRSSAAFPSSAGPFWARRSRDFSVSLLI